MARFQGMSNTAWTPSDLSQSHQIVYKSDELARILDVDGKVQKDGAILCFDGAELLPRTTYGQVWKIYIGYRTPLGAWEQGFFWLDANEEKSAAVADRNEELRTIIESQQFPQHGLVVQKSAFKTEKGAIRHFIRLASADEPFICACGQEF